MDLSTLRVVGMRYVAPTGYAFDGNRTLDLQRDPSNKHDERAVKVMDGGVQVAWVLREDNRDVARLLDRGHRLSLHSPRRLSRATYSFHCTDETVVEELLSYAEVTCAPV